MVDLRKAKSGDVYIDGFGRKVRILCNDRKNGNVYNVVALKESVREEKIMTYTLDGLYWGYTTSKFDLVKRINE